MTQRLFVGLLMLAGVVCAQLSADPRNTYHRVLAIVPMIGTGTTADPHRPKYAPTQGNAAPDGIIGFTQTPTDDGPGAINESVRAVLYESDVQLLGDAE